MLPSGFSVGHWTDPEALTGCTVVLCPAGTIGGCDVRGSSPGSRELALLATEKTMQQVNAVLLTGGSAFGLAAADGVMRFLEEKNIGYETPWGKVPIVPGAVIFDLNIGMPAVRPNAANGYMAASGADNRATHEGNVGAGTGATVGKWGGIETRMKGGLGVASIQQGELIVGAIAVVNAIGDVIDEQGRILAGARGPDGKWLAEHDPHRNFPPALAQQHANTTLVVITTNAGLTKVEANRLAQRGHDGMARAIKPVHTSHDGDLVFCLASGNVDVPFDFVAEIGADVTAMSIRRGVRMARSAGGVAACQ